jgi:hypothetical protein
MTGIRRRNGDILRKRRKRFFSFSSKIPEIRGSSGDDSGRLWKMSRVHAAGTTRGRARGFYMANRSRHPVLAGSLPLTVLLDRKMWTAV